MDRLSKIQCGTQQVNISNELINILMASSDDIMYPSQFIAISKERWQQNDQQFGPDLITPIISLFELLAHLKGRDMSAMQKFLRSYSAILCWRHEVLKVNTKSMEKAKYNDSDTIMEATLEENRRCVRSEENMIALLADELCLETSHIFKRMCISELKVKFSILRSTKHLYKLNKNHSMAMTEHYDNTFKPLSYYYWQEDVDNTWNSLDDDKTLENHQFENDNLQSIFNGSLCNSDQNISCSLIGNAPCNKSSVEIDSIITQQSKNCRHDDDYQISPAAEYDFNNLCQTMQGHNIAISSFYKEIANKDKTLIDSKIQQAQPLSTDQIDRKVDVKDDETSTAQKDDCDVQANVGAIII
ncbi:uncharacterized protein TRIADDRAFT_55192 [Trichoplax adhaerens]|uniref:Uncharacterized protein n=1 Tax=Trichoplax adhaerens TaxID=10228 RepID=B3RU84_TRIAD|nr:predicted protein [Trichoplax adhaerens]EDV25294.1 predicted protein [Trichoplax adhaerens]|eukprot:XP_002111327.1 predicted protein [Trichoplax adhaerens]